MIEKKTILEKERPSSLIAITWEIAPICRSSSSNTAIWGVLWKQDYGGGIGGLRMIL